MNLLRILLAIHASEITLVLQLFVRVFVVKDILLRILFVGKNYAISGMKPATVSLNHKNYFSLYFNFTNWNRSVVRNVQTLIDKGLQAIKNLLDRSFPGEPELQPIRVTRTSPPPFLNDSQNSMAGL